MAEDPVREQRHIQSIEVGFRLINALEIAQAKLPLKQLAALAGMPASKAHLYLVSFMRIGLVVQDASTMRYGLGPYAIQLGLAGMRQLDVLTAARIPMENLQETCNLSAYLSIWSNMGPTIVAKSDGDLEVPMVIKVGHVLPLLASATGRVFLALAPKSKTTDLVAKLPDAASVVKQVIKDGKEEVGRTGVAMSDSRISDGFAAISAPIFDNSGIIVAAMTVIGLRSRVELNPTGRLASSLQLACAEISKTLGFERGSQQFEDFLSQPESNHGRP